MLLMLFRKFQTQRGGGPGIYGFEVEKAKCSKKISSIMLSLHQIFG